MARRARLTGLVISHWYYLIENLQSSSRGFYAAVEQAVERRQIPTAKRLRILWPQGGIFSAHREYLRVKRKSLVFDICGAPFGQGFFVSWWLADRSFLALLSAIPVFGLFLNVLARPYTYYKTDTALMFQEMVHNAVLEIVDQMMNAKGLRLLSVLERKPIMKGFSTR